MLIEMMCMLQSACRLHFMKIFFMHTGIHIYVTVCLQTAFYVSKSKYFFINPMFVRCLTSI